MSDAIGSSPDGESGQPTRSQVQSTAPTDHRWTGSKPLKVACTVLAVCGVAALSGGAIASGSLIVAVSVPIALITLAAVGCFRYWRTNVELTNDGTLIVRTLLRTHQIPAEQILHMRRSDYGIQITLIDGRIVTAGVLQTGWWRRRSQRPDQAANAISTITRAVEEARSARPAETAAAINIAAPLRAKRTIRRVVATIVAGPAMLVASFFVPSAGMNLDWRLRWAGIAYTALSLAAAYSLLRLAHPGGDETYRHRRRR